MNLIDENEVKEQSENKQKMKKIILFTVAALILVVVILVIYSVLKNKNTLKLELDGTNQNISSGLILMTDDGKNVYTEDGHIYFSIRKLKDMIGNIEIFNDEYKNKGEDSTKCHIKVGNEYTSYISNSDQIYKAVIYEDTVDNNTGTSSNNKSSNTQTETELITEYEYFTVEKPVKYINGELYASDDAIELGFNVILSYDTSKKQITIYTLDALEKSANSKVTTNTAVIGDDCDYYNKKLLKYGLILVKNSSGNYGITNYNTNKEIMTCTYSKIRFSESTATVTVTSASDNLQGIFKLDLVNQTSECKIQPTYQLIRQIDEDEELYVIKSNNKYGVIKISGESIEKVIDAEYEQMGLDKAYENMNNKYIIEGNKKYIPVKIDGKWGVYTVDGKRAIYTQYDGIGCTLGTSGDPVIIIPDLVDGADAFVCEKDVTVDSGSSNAANTKNEVTVQYVLVNAQTREEFGQATSEIYSKYEEALNGESKRVYYMKLDVNGTTIRNIDITTTYGKKSKTVTSTDEINQTTENNSTTTNENSTTTNSSSTTTNNSNTVNNTTVNSNNTIINDDTNAVSSQTSDTNTQN